MSEFTIVLASKSPRRQELIKEAVGNLEKLIVKFQKQYRENNKEKIKETKKPGA